MQIDHKKKDYKFGFGLTVGWRIRKAEWCIITFIYISSLLPATQQSCASASTSTSTSTLCLKIIKSILQSFELRILNGVVSAGATVLEPHLPHLLLFSLKSFCYPFRCVEFLSVRIEIFYFICMYGFGLREKALFHKMCRQSPCSWLIMPVYSFALFSNLFTYFFLKISLVTTIAD